MKLYVMSIKGDNRASELKGYHQATTIAQKNMGILILVIKEESSHRLLFVQKNCKTCRLVKLITSRHFSFRSGGYRGTMQLGTKTVSYPCVRRALLILLSSEVIGCLPWPFMLDIKFAFSNTAFDMASPRPRYTHVFLPEKGRS